MHLQFSFLSTTLPIDNGREIHVRVRPHDWRRVAAAHSVAPPAKYDSTQFGQDCSPLRNDKLSRRTRVPISDKAALAAVKHASMDP